MFHASVQLSRASVQTTLRQLKSRIARAVAQDKELVLDPAFFQAVGARLGMSAQIQLRRGRFANELTHYRYDVVLCAQNAGPAEAPEVLDGNEGDLLERLDRHLRQQRPGRVLLKQIPNARLARDLAAWERVADE